MNEALLDMVAADYFEVPTTSKELELFKSVKDIEKEIELNSKRMLKAASDLHFEKAAHFRDRVRHLRELLMEMTSHPSTPTSETFSKSNTPK